MKITVTQAAEILGKTEDEVRQWISDGILACRIISDQTLLDGPDVYEIREILDRGEVVKKPFERLALLELRTKRLERLVNSLCRICQVPVTMTLQHLSDKDLYKIYADALNSMGQDSWSDVELKKWASNSSAVAWPRYHESAKN